MSKSETKAKEILDLLKQGKSIESIKQSISSSNDEWYRYSSKAYFLALELARIQRKKDKDEPNVLATSNREILEILDLNEILADYALILPIFSTTSDFHTIKNLVSNLPTSEKDVIQCIGKITMHPRLRVLQKKGRLEKFNYFKEFVTMIDAAVLCYYRTNFISCYLTLLPIIEGIIIRWMGYTEMDEKPEFEEIRKFFIKSSQRQPCPGNILFHNVYVKACHKILNNHFYKPTTSTGVAYANFNRHVASHLLKNDQFATKENCIRLFILLDSMTEIFLYESRISDPRFNLKNEEIQDDISTLFMALMGNNEKTPEHIILGTDISALIL